MKAERSSTLIHSHSAPEWRGLGSHRLSWTLEPVQSPWVHESGWVDERAWEWMRVYGSGRSDKSGSHVLSHSLIHVWFEPEAYWTLTLLKQCTKISIKKNLGAPAWHFCDFHSDSSLGAGLASAAASFGSLWSTMGLLFTFLISWDKNRNGQSDGSLDSVSCSPPGQGLRKFFTPGNI